GYSTKDKLLQAETISISSNWQKNEQLRQSGQARAELYSLELPTLTINELDLLQALKSAQLAVGSIVLQNPALDVRMAAGVQQKVIPSEQQNGLEPVWAVLD